MLFDDRLATVLRMRAGSEAALRTQFRQLLDLLGTRDPGVPGDALARIARSAARLPASEIERMLVRPALEKGDARLATISGFVRLHELQQAIPQETQSAILREPGLRLRDPEFVAFLAEGDPKPAAAAVATARLSEAQWLDLIPRLPVTARGFLRHRRDLPEGVKRLLSQLGVRDLVLPMGSMAEEEAAAMAASEAGREASDVSPVAGTPASEEGIGALRRRIEAFRENRQQAKTAPRLPLGDSAAQPDAPGHDVLDIVTDGAGNVVSADGFAAPMLVGLKLTAPAPGTLVSFEDDVAAQLRRHLPLRQAHLTIDAAPEISGEWRMDATPLFATATGGFTGYAARLYRPNRPVVSGREDSQADAMRQVLHELRTPVNAIQGFAEIIQQQIFATVPHEYRAHAAAIAVDAAKLLAGFEEVDRLVRLESRAMQLEEGSCDFRAALADTVERLQRVLRPRNAGFALEISGSHFTVGFDRTEAMAMCWRLLATAAGALGPGEESRLALSGDEAGITLDLSVPESLRAAAPDTSREGQRRSVVSAGMFGPRFTFRLVEAEVRAAGGSLSCEGDRVTLRLPTLTSTGASHSTGTGSQGNGP
ncbi:sensor histidine kinase [Aurantiacibacter hainanensis]|uniref:sensor histidine kinase n=1 Tax=Aurantiacibacter hainanensis TaxID=3076114 RepID=UPI0030C7176E